MRLPLTFIAGVLTIATAAIAEPPTSAPQKPAQPQGHPAEIVLASADAVPSPNPDASRNAPTPAKRRIARVTTCRCGDPQTGADSQEQ